MFSNKTVSSSNTNNINNSSIIGFSFTVRPPPQQQQQQPQKIQQSVVQLSTEKKMKWGEPTWFLFHTLSYKLKDEFFSSFKNEFLNICFLICRNLPCPTCAEHATQYMQNINFNAIKTKEQLKDLFFEFHNTVNKKKGFSIFNRIDLDDKYSKANTQPIIQNFLVHFRDKSRSVRNISNDFFRERTYQQLIQWFSKNISYFNP